MLATSATLVSLEINQLGLSQKDQPTTKRAHKAIGITNVRAGYYRKFNIDRNDVRDVIRAAQNARSYHRELTVPWGHGDYRMLPAPLIMKYTRGLKDYKAKFFASVDDVVTRWPVILRNSSLRLGSAFNGADYPHPTRIKGFYSFDTHFKPVPQDDHFILEVERETLEALKREFAKDENKNMEEAVNDLFRRLHTVVDNMATQLSNKKGKIHNSLLTNVEDLIEILPDLNIMNDPMLTALCQEAKDQLLTFTPGQLKKDSSARKTTALAAQTISDKMSGIMGGKSKQ